MKTLFLLFTTILFSQFGFSQDFDHILYKQECDKAYQLTFQKGEFEKSTKKLTEIQQSYGLLYSEEKFLMALNYKALGDTMQAAKTMREAWLGEFFDFNILFESNRMSPLYMYVGFSQEHIDIVESAWEIDKKRDFTLRDSLLIVYNAMEELDQKFRLIKRTGLSDTKLKQLNSEMVKTDSLNIRRFQEIIKTVGYPGPKIFPNNAGQFSTILLHSSYYKWAFAELKPTLLEEVKAGRMAPSNYVQWLDRHNLAFDLPLEYGILGLESQFNLSTAEEKQVRKNRIKYGLVSHYPIPSLGLSFEKY